MPPTTSTLPALKAALKTLLTNALATAGAGGGPVQVSYAWPGSSAQAESVFLGRHPALTSNPLESTRLDSKVSAIKAGRTPREETYAVEVTVWSFQPQLTPADAQTAEARAFVLAGHVEDVIADNARSQFGVDGITKAGIDQWEIGLLPFEKGWVAHLVLSVQITARLS